MKQLLALLPYVTADSYELAVAKGLHYLPRNPSEVHERNKRTAIWQRKESRM